MPVFAFYGFSATFQKIILGCLARISLKPKRLRIQGDKLSEINAQYICYLLQVDKGRD
jgi:hypothetical protein